MVPTGGSIAAITPADLSGATAAIQAWHTSAGAKIASVCKLSSVKMNIIGVDGKYENLVTSEQLVADVAGGDLGSPRYPNQVALAISLTTGYSRGPAHRGRFYMPLPNHGMGSDSLVALSERTATVTAATNLLTALNAVNANLKVGVYSRKLGAAAHRLVTGIQVGRVLDTQRRRRRSLLENY
jgi:hypothetical protein